MNYSPVNSDSPLIIILTFNTNFKGKIRWNYPSPSILQLDKIRIDTSGNMQGITETVVFTFTLQDS